MRTQHQHRDDIRRIVTQHLSDMLTPEDVERLIEHIVVKDWSGNEDDLGTCIVHIKYSEQPNDTDLTTQYGIPEMIVDMSSNERRNQYELHCRVIDTEYLVKVDGWGRETIFRFLGSPAYPRAEIRNTQLHLYQEKLTKLEVKLFYQYASDSLSEQDFERQANEIKADRQRIDSLMGQN